MSPPSIFQNPQIGRLDKKRQGLRYCNEYPNPCIVGMTGLEPATSRPPDACANQLRYIPKPCALKAFAFLATAKIVTICEITKLFREFLLL